jgi:dipeptidyl aminopeptidase/acylaminoacyl peptidase
MRKFVLLFLCLAFAPVAFTQTQKPLDHSVYDHWKDLGHAIISDNGQAVSYEVNPQQGDGWLYVYEVQKKRLDSLPRGHHAHFMLNGKVLVYNIKPQFEKVLHLERKKVKKDKLPSDSLAVYSLVSGTVKRFGQVKKVAVSVKPSGKWIAAWMKKQPAKKKKTTDKDKPEKKEKKLKKAKGAPLMLYNVATGDSLRFQNVTLFALSKNGQTCIFAGVPRDTVDRVFVAVFSAKTGKTDTLVSARAYVKNVAVDEQGNQVAYTFSKDTVKNKAYGLFYVDLKKNKRTWVSGTNEQNMRKGWSVSPFGKIFFNKTGTELFFGTAPKPLPPLKDTLAPSEKVSLDIWTYRDTLLQPQQKLRVKREKQRSYVAVYFPKEGRMVQLAVPAMKEVQINSKAKGIYSLGFDNRPYLKMTSWIGQWYSDVYLVNRQTGQRKLIIPKVAYGVGISPGQQFVSWYNLQDSAWYAYNVKTGKSVCVTANIKVPLYNELNDVPNMAPPYGMAGWTKNDKMVVYDKYDLWLVDPAGNEQPVNLTSGTGRKENLRFRYVKLDKETLWLPDKMLLSVFQLKNKKAGFYALNLKNRKPVKLLLDDYAYSRPLKAKKAPELIWRRQRFQVYPDLYIGNLDFSDVLKISNANPQQKNYLWGSVQLVQWISFNGDTLQGLLYKPGNFDPQKKYPMLVYFYERYSDRLHRYYAPRPIRSVINFSYYASNGYVIFVPDIKYRVGWPGASAYDAVVSGTEAMCSRFPFIDRSRLGMQGQSWGGYQSAYLVTQTDLFRCAEAGAPVSNMTSAYGGIRWGSGMSREFQYEHTQSRIGGTLWDKLPLYMQNSPLFFVPRIHTPLLIMHNDKDNAVPWYQGIELFSAMRRLNKPVWMLVYNGQPHNLSRRADEKDLTRRFQQFFDYFLKGAPEPEWMKTGVPAIKKGRDFGFEPEKEK